MGGILGSTIRKRWGCSSELRVAGLPHLNRVFRKMQWERALTHFSDRFSIPKGVVEIVESRDPTHSFNWPTERGRYAAETRPRNRTFRIWERTA
ncbi:hypothetical protein S1OALGB6SA_2333 [Olavius algarvensis spirochete endosymbiont]|nr:hypothetical protein S1OALGB6SA_2333 [Olavius algarvensis spirochete endosymbiont]